MYVCVSAGKHVRFQLNVALYLENECSISEVIFAYSISFQSRLELSDFFYYDKKFDSKTAIYIKDSQQQFNSGQLKRNLVNVSSKL